MVSPHVKKYVLPIGAIVMIIGITGTVAVVQQYQTPEQHNQIIMSKQKYDDMIANKYVIDQKKIAFFTVLCPMYATIQKDGVRLQNVSQQKNAPITTVLSDMGDTLATTSHHFAHMSHKMRKMEHKFSGEHWSKNVGELSDSMSQWSKNYHAMSHNITTISVTQGKDVFQKQFDAKVSQPLQRNNASVSRAMSDTVSAVGIGEGLTRRDIMAIPACTPLFYDTNSTFIEAFGDNSFLNDRDIQRDTDMQKAINEQKRKNAAERKKREEKAAEEFERKNRSLMQQLVDKINEGKKH